MELLVNQEFRNLIPPLEPSELALLEESILEEGVRDALIIWNGYIVDGHNRYDIIVKHGIKDYRVVNKHFVDAEATKIWIMKNQVGRRNISLYLRAEYVMKIKDWEDKRRQGKEIKEANLKQNIDTSKVQSCTIDTDVELATKLGIGQRTASKIIKIDKEAQEELKEKLRKGEATVNQVYVKIRREEIKNNLKTAEWPKGKYRIIYADPPWKYGNNNPPGFVEQSDHYSTYTVDEIIEKFPVSNIALENSVLFIWSTSPILEEVFDVIRSWGFEYKSSFVWDKVKHVMGHYNSVRHELLLIATKGSCQPDITKLYDSVITIERNRHSEKPDIFREIIDTLYPYGPRVELFATKKSEGWDVFGNGIR